jgi:adenylate cyclase
MADERHRLVQRLRDAGQSDEAIADAGDDGRLPTLAVELALFGDDALTLTTLARESHLASDFLRELMQAAGRPNPRRGERVFTDDDLEFARMVRTLLDAGLPREGLIDAVRVISQGMAQAAEAVRALVGDALLRPGDSEHAVGLRYAEASDAMAPLIPRMLDYHFRGQLRDSVRRAVLTAAEREVGELDGIERVAIAFADLVDYTGIGEQLPADEVGRMAGRLAQVAAKASRPGVRLVKMIGDAAMFVSDDAPALVETCERLCEAVAGEDDGFPDVRIGMSCGSATNRGGDWFGTAVNVASRVCAEAKPGQVLATEDIREAAPGHDWRRRRKRSLKGLDARVRVFSLERQS